MPSETPTVGSVWGDPEKPETWRLISLPDEPAYGWAFGSRIETICDGMPGKLVDITALVAAGRGE